MAKKIYTSIDIKATPEVIWNILTNFKEYPNWNPFIKSITGTPKVGNQLVVKFEDMTFKPTVLTSKKNIELKWLGHLFFKGLFDGEHQFYLKHNSNGTTNFTQSEQFSGILTLIFSNKKLEQTKNGFQQMNNALKLLAEKEMELL